MTNLTNKGFASFAVLMVAAMIGLGVAYSLSMGFGGSLKGVAYADAKQIFENHVSTLQMVLESPTICQHSGLIGSVFNPSNPSTTTLQLRLPGGEVFLEEGKVSGLLEVPAGGLRIRTPFTSLGTNGALTAYMAAIHLEESAKNQGTRQFSKDIFVTLKLDATNTVTECFGGGLKLNLTNVKCDTYHIFVDANGNQGTQEEPLPYKVDPCNLAPGPLPDHVEAACPAGMRLVSCNMRCQGSSLKRCVALPSNNNTRCWGQCIDGLGNVCGKTPTGMRGWAQVNMTCTPD